MGGSQISCQLHLGENIRPFSHSSTMWVKDPLESKTAEVQQCAWLLQLWTYFVACKSVWPYSRVLFVENPIKAMCILMAFVMEAHTSCFVHQHLSSKSTMRHQLPSVHHSAGQYTLHSIRAFIAYSQFITILVQVLWTKLKLIRNPQLCWSFCYMWSLLLIRNLLKKHKLQVLQRTTCQAYPLP